MVGIILVSIAIVLFTAWLLSRVLGIPGSRRLVTAAAVGFGAAATMAILQAVTGERWNFSTRWVVVGSALVPVLSGIALVLLDLLTARPRRGSHWNWRHPISSLTDSIRRGWRYLQVAAIALRNGLLRRGRDESDAPESRLGRSLAATLEDAGVLFVKLGQAMASQPQLVSRPIAAELTRLQDQAAPADPIAARKVIEDEIGPPETVFASFSAAPAASASIAQTYFAVLEGGREVVVKVQRPNIQKPVERDLDILVRLVSSLERHTSWAADLGVKELAEGFAESTREELDFRIEAGNVAAARKMLGDDELITVPEVFDEFTTRRVLVEERVDGRSLTTPGEMDRFEPVRRVQMADALLSLMMRQMVNGEIFHADPHPGNVFVSSDGRLALIDFGAVGRLNRIERSGLIDLLRGFQTEDPALLRQAALLIGKATDRIDAESFDRELARLMSRSKSADGTFGPELMMDTLTVFRDFGVMMPRSTTTLFRTLMTLQGTLNVIAPDYQLLDAATRLGGDLLGDVLAPGGLRGFAEQQALTVAPVLARLPRDVDDVARSLLRGELRARVSLLSEPDDVAVASRLLNRFLLALIGGAMMVASALMLTVADDGGDRAAVLTVIGAIGLGFSMLLLLRVVVLVLRDDH